jgi:bifunctional enzyme CysN/CysC
VKVLVEPNLAATAVAPSSFTVYRDRLGVLTCGSVDAGKSTLISRLLLDASQVFNERCAHDSKTSLAGEIDPALPLDRLEIERERGISVDVACRHFCTPRRTFVIADAPGHRDSSPKLLTLGSTSDLAILLVGAERDLPEQTRRHAFLCSLLGIRHFVLVVNKMDLIDFDECRFQEIAESFARFSGRFAAHVVAIPTCALHGDNVVQPSVRMPWYRGLSLLKHLESVVVDPRPGTAPLRLPVQLINQQESKFHGYAGTIASGTLRQGMEIVIPRTGVRSRIARILTIDGDIDNAAAPDAVTVVLADEIDVSRGDIISSIEKPALSADAFAAHVVSTSEAPLLPGRGYLLKSGAQTVGAMVTELKYRIDIENFDHLAAKELQPNEVAFVNLATAAPINFDAYDDNRATGRFILIDRHSNATVAIGLFRFGLRRAANTYFQSFEVTKAARAQLNAQKPALLWFTGLSGAGKSTIANNLEKKLHALGKRTFILDGDNVRHGLNRDLGFTEADRVENIRRIAEVAKLFVDAGLITLVAFISPFQAEREMARELVAPGEFIEIFVNTALEICEQRDPKGLYKKARRGELQNFTGLDSPYERPINPELILDARNESPSDLADRIIDFMLQCGMLS